jgi:hypothetical protein
MVSPYHMELRRAYKKTPLEMLFTTSIHEEGRRTKAKGPVTVKFVLKPIGGFLNMWVTLGWPLA